MGSNSSSKLIGITLIVVGAGLIYWGYDMSGSLDSKFIQAFTGSNSNDVMFRYIGGAASFVAGLFLFLKK